MLMIQKNPKLAMIKSDVILGKIYETWFTYSQFS